MNYLVISIINVHLFGEPNKKYCPQCAKEIKLEQTRDVAREGMRKLREQRKDVKKASNPEKH